MCVLPKRRPPRICAIITALVALLAPAAAQDTAALERDFARPPGTVQTSVYWYWLSGNISREGVVKDLHAMKKAGINRAFIGNIGMEDKAAPRNNAGIYSEGWYDMDSGRIRGTYGPVQLFSEEWWDIVRTALKTAGELDIEIGIFNSPGWSQSGGPWVSLDQSMRYLAASEIRVTGPQSLSQKIPPPTPEFKDVRVLAWEVPANHNENLLLRAARVSLNDEDANFKDGGAAFHLTAGKNTVVDIIFAEPAAAQSLVLKIGRGTAAYDGVVEVGENGGFRTLKKFSVNRVNHSANVGFLPFAPVAESFAKTAARHFRITFQNIRANAKIEELRLSGTAVVENYVEKTLGKMFQSPLPMFDAYRWEKPAGVANDPSAIPVKKILDLSQKLAADGTLQWNTPKGDWVVQRIGMAPTGVTNSPAAPEGRGREVDKMNRRHVAAHFDAFIGEILRRVPAQERRTFRVIVADSYEVGGQNFTDGFIEEFKKKLGYDPVPFLPVYQGVVVESTDASERFLWDVRRFVADKIAYDYVGGLREAGRKHGLSTWLENYGHWGFAGEFLQYGGQSDEVGGEFWAEGELGSIEIKAAASAANIYGKNKVSAESFTSAGNAFGRHPASIKRRGDWSFTEGVNNTLLHVYIHQPKDTGGVGMHAWFGTEFNRLNTWFPQMDLFTDYLKRANLMLQQGLNVADVAYFIGEDTPKMTGAQNPRLPAGFSFDYINAEVIERSLAVKNGALVLPHGTAYRVLVLPPLDTMRPELLRKIDRLVRDGGVVLGPPPGRSPSLQNFPRADNVVQSLAKTIWGDLDGKTPVPRQHGKGLVFHGATLEQAFAHLNTAPDCVLPDPRQVLFTHRKIGDTDIYFLSNQTDRELALTPKFRVTGKQPELWDAVTGTKRPLPAYGQADGMTTVPLQFAPTQSMFIVFSRAGKPATADPAANFPAQQTVLELNKNWEVRFESDPVKRGPTAPVAFPELLDWTKHPDDTIRFYSGTARYRTTFTLGQTAPAAPLTLDLGRVGVMAKVWLNGEYAGGVWTPPYALEVSRLVKPGENTLEVEVVSTWQNRLIGDDPLPAEQRPVTPHSGWPKTAPLAPSGLIGPVRLLTPGAR